MVIDFFATWCGPCKDIAPKIVKLAKKMADKVVFLKVSKAKTIDKSENIFIFCDKIFRLMLMRVMI